MKCNLIKKIKVVENDKGEKRSFANYFLEFENGVTIPVVCRYYTTNSKDAKELSKIHDLNVRNSSKMDTLADTIKE